MSTYYILYDSSRIHWFSDKEKTDLRNLKAIFRKITQNKNLIHEEIVLSDSLRNKIKSSLLLSVEEVLPLIREENPFLLPILFPENLN